MIQLSEKLRGLFEAAGWTSGVQRPSRKRSHEYQANPHAFDVLAEFGGLHVGTRGAGRDCARSDVNFWDRPDWESSDLVRRWFPELGRMVGIGSAHAEHIVLYVAENGRFYLFTTPDGRLYLGGDDFCEVMERLLLGLDLGDAL